MVLGNIIPFAALLMLTACGEWLTDKTVTKPTYPADGVKLIESSIDSGDDEQTYNQTSFKVTANSRVLLRRQDLSQREGNLLIDGSNPVTLTINLEDATQKDAAKQSLKLCRLTKNWMMLATWKKAHPFARSGVWSNPGADFEKSECLLPTDGDAESALKYDVTAVVVARVRGHAGENFGFVLIDDSAEMDFEIAGDNAGSSSPAFNWTEVVSTGI